ncbi:MAG: glutamine synthetase family protein [Acidimicrobiia bacterium]
MDKQAEYVLSTVEERGIRFVRLWFTDVLGFLKSVAITPAELEGVMNDGMSFDGSSIDGFSRIQEADMIAKPDPTTFQLLPWRPDEGGVARIFCDIVTPSGEPFDGDPRWALKRNLRRLSERGYTLDIAPELEFYYFQDSSPDRTVLDRGGYFDLTPLDVAQEYRRRSIVVLEQLGIPVESSHHEQSAGQHEIDLRGADALTMADQLLTARLAIKEVAMENGMYATFMPKPLQEAAGSAMHLHLSLFEGEVNAFHEPSDGLSKVGEAFIAGLLAHARELTAITNQWVNSYKLLHGGFEAPTFVTWAHNNDSALIRVPTIQAGQPDRTRIEYRSPDPACNPYLAFSALVAAGLAGIERGYELPAETLENMAVTEADVSAPPSVDRLPSGLDEALDALESSELMKDALGDHIVEWFLKNKRDEWRRYRRHVSLFEVEENLPIL